MGISVYMIDSPLNQLTDAFLRTLSQYTSFSIYAILSTSRIRGESEF